MKVFLGGTCNNSVWRNELIKTLEVDYFNPIVEDWTEECYQEELKQRKLCDKVLYVITSEMTGVYSIAEAVDDSNKQPAKTIFVFFKKGFDNGQIKSLDKVGKMIKENGGKYLEVNTVSDISDYLNNLDNVTESIVKGSFNKLYTRLLKST